MRRAWLASIPPGGRRRHFYEPATTPLIPPAPPAVVCGAANPRREQAGLGVPHQWEGAGCIAHGQAPGARQWRGASLIGWGRPPPGEEAGLTGSTLGGPADTADDGRLNHQQLGRDDDACCRRRPPRPVDCCQGRQRHLPDGGQEQRCSTRTKDGAALRQAPLDAGRRAGSEQHSPSLGVSPRTSSGWQESASRAGPATHPAQDTATIGHAPAAASPE